MRIYATIIFPIALVLAGCASPSSRPTNATATTNWFITQLGTHRSADGIWQVSVPSADQPVELTRWQYLTNVRSGFILSWNGALTNTYTKSGWRAQPGWFVFVEDASRAWCYDGSNFLWLLQVDSDGSASYGPGSFPCPVPQPVYARLSVSVQRTIAGPDQTTRMPGKPSR